MLSVLRAALTAIMLAGFYLTALVQLGLSIALAVWLGSMLNGAVAFKITLPLFTATVGAVAVALWKGMRARDDPPHGLSVGPDQAPALWGVVHQLAGEVGTRVPDEIRLVPEINAAVQENARLLGLVGGRRRLYIGLPLLLTLSVDQLRAVLAHELGHYSGLHTRLGAVAYRGRLAIGGTIGRIGPYNVAGWGFRAYARLYLLVDSAVIRRQELAADRAAVRVAGRAAAAGALRELPVLDAAWGFFLRNYVEPAWEVGYAPDDLFAGFAELLAARKGELAELRDAEPERRRSRWDTHPPVGDRIAAIAAAPEGRAQHDGRPAGPVLLPRLPDLARRLQAEMLDVGDRTVLPWFELTADSLRARTQRRADTVFRAVARVTGTPQVSLATILELAAANRLAPVAESLHPDGSTREALEAFAEPLAVLIELAAMNSRVASWRHSWSGPAEFVGRDGQPLPLAEIAGQAVWPQTAYRAWHRLASIGIDAAAAALVEQRATADGADIIAAFANVKVDGTEHDLLVLNKGFIFVGDPGKSGEGKDRLRGLVQSAPPAELARRHRFLPYEEVASASIDKRVPTRAELVLHGGRRVSLHEGWSSEEIAKGSRDVLLEVLEALG
ncbi:MAG TPA: M48 family metallopeptidase [Pilimelia sp.]|nr:M48 family metallopeptidase [Pilimelia sp.]